MLLAGLVLGVQPAAAQPVATMSELMIKIIYPASDAVFYITTRRPHDRERLGPTAGPDADARRVRQPADDARPRPRPGSLDGGRETAPRSRARRRSRRPRPKTRLRSMR